MTAEHNGHDAFRRPLSSQSSGMISQPVTDHWDHLKTDSPYLCGISALCQLILPTNCSESLHELSRLRIFGRLLLFLVTFSDTANIMCLPRVISKPLLRFCALADCRNKRFWRELNVLRIYVRFWQALNIYMTLNMLKPKIAQHAKPEGMSIVSRIYVIAKGRRYYFWPE